jgi:lysozyme
MMKASPDGIRFLTSWEKFKPVASPDVSGIMDIGFGHRVQPGERFTTISVNAATQMMENDVSYCENIINNYVEIDLKQNEFDALVSLVYNIGRGNFMKSTLLKMLNTGTIATAAQQFLVWRLAGGKVIKGLEHRRMAERDIFLYAHYVYTH